MIGRIIKPNWFLEGRLEDGGRWTVPIDTNPFVVGRDEECNLKLLPDYISRRHAEIRTKDTGLFLRDLRSKNGTFINERRISEEVRLEHRDDIRFGSLKFQIVMKDQRGARIPMETSLLKVPLKVKSFMDNYQISKREEQVLCQLLQGKSTKKIADILCISEGTAKNHILNIYKKTDTHSRFELSALFTSFSV